jgi:polyhydroxyalkanoate synthesis regulator phasin
MRNMRFQGIPDVSNETPQRAIKILYDHCYLAAQVLDTVNQEVEELKEQVKELSRRLR